MSARDEPVYERRMFRERHDAAAWSASEHWYHPDLHPEPNDWAFRAIGPFLSAMAAVGLVYWIVRVAVSVWPR